jgi:lysine-specific permease
MIACVVIALMAGYSYFVPANAVGLIGNYAGLILCVLGFIVTKLWTKSKMVPIAEIDIDTGRSDLRFAANEKAEISGPWYKRAWKRFVYIVT